MLNPVYTKRFEKDVKLARRRGKDLGKLKKVIESLLAQEVLSIQYRDHILIGNYKGRRACHIEPDWLLFTCLNLTK